MKYFKYLSSILLFFVLGTGFVLSTFSCSNSTKLNASKAKIAQLKKDSTSLRIALNRKEKAEIKSEKAKIERVESLKETKLAMPSLLVAKKFKEDFPGMIEVSWSEDKGTLKPAESPKKDFRAYFLIDDNKNWAFYDTEGKLLETRVAILPARLPSYLIKAIELKYPGMEILSAATFKHFEVKGSYIVVIKPKANTELKELVLAENGTILE